MNLSLAKQKKTNNEKGNVENERKNINEPFDELAKGMAQSLTRRQALKQFGIGVAGMALACFGSANKAEAAKKCRSESRA